MARVQVSPATCTEHGKGAVSQRNSSLPEEGCWAGESSSRPLWMVRAAALSEGWAFAQPRPLRLRRVTEGLYSLVAGFMGVMALGGDLSSEWDLGRQRSLGGRDGGESEKMYSGASEPARPGELAKGRGGR